MTRNVCLAVLLALAVTAAVRASEPCGIYARVDKVEVGPKAEAPEWVKIHGDFILVMDSGNEHGPQRGYLHFSLVKDKAELCRLEWADLKKLAGTKTNFVAFGSAHSPINHDLDKVRRAGEAAGTPSPYPLNHGLYRLRTENPDRPNSQDSPAKPVAKLQKYLKDNPLP